jgi:hypothetical protein
MTYRCAHCQRVLATESTPEPCPDHPDAGIAVDMSATVYGEGHAE